MKVALVRANYHSIWEPLSLGYIKAFADQCDWCREHVDWQFVDGALDKARQLRKACKADLIGISATVPQMAWANRLHHQAKKKNPKAVTVMGGYGPSTAPWMAETDCTIKGDGEIWFHHLIHQVAKKRHPKRTFRKGVLQELDDLPHPDRRFLKLERYIKIAQQDEGRRVTGISGSRGCLRRCKFCADGSEETIYGVPLRERSSRLIVQEMHDVMRDYGIDFLKFTDAELNSSPGRIAGLCGDIFRDTQVIPEWGANIVANPFSADDAELLYEARCREVWIGLETGSPKLLAEMGKGTTIKTIKDAFKVSKAVGLIRRAYIILGLPGEDKETIKQTEALIEEVDPDFVSFSILCPYPGTAYYTANVHMEFKNMELDWETMDEYSNDVWRTPALSNDNLKAEQHRLMAKFEDKLPPIMKKKLDEGVIS
jgi:radical SAM superfamily enzyme YgiQ (UPF0313 family)